MNVEALLKVVEILEATPNEDLNLQSWVSCAIGHSARNPWFTERGLKLSGGGYPAYQNTDTICWDAVKDFFNLTAYQCNWLFNADYYQDDDYDNYDELTAVNKQQVINRIKEFVKGIN
jgi:hypothetical protein